jgi:hypothetical protein
MKNEHHEFFHRMLRLLAEREKKLTCEYDDYRYEMVRAMYFMLPFSDYERYWEMPTETL